MPTQIVLTSKKDFRAITQAGAFEISALDGDDVVATSEFNAGGDPGNYIDDGAGNDTISDGHLWHLYQHRPAGSGSTGNRLVSY